MEFLVIRPSRLLPHLWPSYFRSRNKDNSNKKLTKRKSAEATPTGSGNLNNGGGFRFQMKQPQAGEDLNFDSLSETEPASGLYDEEFEFNDITQDDSVSIFEVISVRYLKSGYLECFAQKITVVTKTKLNKNRNLIVLMSTWTMNMTMANFFFRCNSNICNLNIKVKRHTC